MRLPALYKVDTLKNWEIRKLTHDNWWVLARPFSYPGFHLFRRLKLCWLVFIGKYDVVDWDDD